MWLEIEFMIFYGTKGIIVISTIINRTLTMRRHTAQGNKLGSSVNPKLFDIQEKKY